MEQKSYSLITIFLVIIISFVSDLLGSYPIFLVDMDNFRNYHFYFPIFQIINIIVNPLLVFIVFYQIGKTFDLKTNLKSVIIRLLSGAYLAHFLSYNILYLIIGIDSFWFDSYFSIFIGSVFSLSFLITFFTAFTALAIAYLRNHESEIQ